MLQSALDSHPELRCRGEIFNAKHTGREFVGLSAEEIYARCIGPGEGGIVHAMPGNWPGHSPAALDVWPIVEREQPVVIQLWRRDQLRRLASHARSRRDKCWTRRSPGGWQAVPVGVEIPAEEIPREIDLAQHALAEGLSRFPWALRVDYEDLLADWDGQLGRIQRAIGVSEVLPLRPRTLRQGGGPIREVVTNFDALKAEFATTKYARWFDLAEVGENPRGRV